MSQTLAILHESYRALNARKMFWIVLILSGLAVAGMACVGNNEYGITLLGWDMIPASQFSTDTMAPATFYKWVFSTVGISLWLTWIASILALISTASIFPDFLSEGGIDLVLAKPISRLRLFITKYLGGLLFVVLQVTIYTAGGFLIIGLRGGVWEPSVLLAIPIVVVFFSYLFGFCAMIGVMTRSPVAAILLTILLWFCLFILNSIDSGTLGYSTASKAELEMITQRRILLETELQLRREGVRQEPNEPAEAFEVDEFHPDRIVTPTGFSMSTRSPRALTTEEIHEEIDHLDAMEDERREASELVGKINRIVVQVKTFLPKTSDTIELLNRYTLSPEELGAGEMEKEVIEAQRSRSLWWIVGTSLLFEAFVVGIGAWIFCRRDF